MHFEVCGTFANYLSFLRLACNIMCVSDAAFASVEVQRAKTAVAKRDQRRRNDPTFVQQSLLVGAHGLLASSTFLQYAFRCAWSKWPERPKAERAGWQQCFLSPRTFSCSDYSQRPFQSRRTRQRRITWVRRPWSRWRVKRWSFVSKDAKTGRMDQSFDASAGVTAAARPARFTLCGSSSQTYLMGPSLSRPFPIRMP